jgi:hypothetical protein
VECPFPRGKQNYKIKKRATCLSFFLAGVEGKSGSNFGSSIGNRTYTAPRFAGSKNTWAADLCTYIKARVYMYIRAAGIALRSFSSKLVPRFFVSSLVVFFNKIYGRRLTFKKVQNKRSA